MGGGEPMNSVLLGPLEEWHNNFKKREKERCLCKNFVTEDRNRTRNDPHSSLTINPLSLSWQVQLLHHLTVLRFEKDSRELLAQNQGKRLEMLLVSIPVGYFSCFTLNGIDCPGVSALKSVPQEWLSAVLFWEMLGI